MAEDASKVSEAAPPPPPSPPPPPPEVPYEPRRPINKGRLILLLTLVFIAVLVRGLFKLLRIEKVFCFHFLWGKCDLFHFVLDLATQRINRLKGEFSFFYP